MENKIIRAGVIGLGVGEQHLKSYTAIDGVEVRAICDIDPQRLDRVGNDWGISERYTDSRRITEHPDLDVVSICSYDDTHADQAVSAFEHGKHVMVEKPVALFREDAERVLRAQQESSRYITSNLILRQSPRFIELREQIQAGLFGEIFHIEGDYVHDILWKITEGWRGKMAFYSVMYGGGIHLIDLMRWLIGDEIESVCSMGSNIRTRDTSYPYDDCIVSLLKFSRGATGKTLSTYGPRRTKFHALNVYGVERTFVNDLPNAKMFTGDQAEDESAIITPYPGMRKGDLLPDLIEGIRNGHEPNVSARDVFRIMDVCFAAHEALETGRQVDVKYQI